METDTQNDILSEYTISSIYYVYLSEIVTFCFIALHSSQIVFPLAMLSDVLLVITGQRSIQ